MAEVQKKASEGSLFGMEQPPMPKPQPAPQQTARNRWQPRHHNTGAKSKSRCSCPSSRLRFRNPFHSRNRCTARTAYRQPAPQPVPQQAAPQPQEIQFHQPVQVPQPQLADNRWMQQPAPSQYATVQEAAMYNFDKDCEDDREMLREDPYAEYPDFPKECRMTDMAQMDMVYC